MPKSIETAVRIKPAKPRPDFPLFPHANGRWAKKIKGRLVYFGKWHDPDAALALYVLQRDDLYAGRKPRDGKTDGLTVRDLLNHFLTAKQHLVDTGELSPRSFRDYKDTCEFVKDAFGLTRLVVDLRPDDFAALRMKVAKTRGAVSLGNVIQRVRSLFKFAFDSDLIEKPVKFGPVFKRPTKKTLRRIRGERGPRMFDAVTLNRILDGAEQPLKAMILLGINCAFGNGDCGVLPMRALDLKAGWVRFPRPKTGVDRRCPLWPETIKAIKEWLTIRPKPKNEADANLVFLTKFGASWHKDTPDNPVAKEFRKLVDELGVHQHGVGFYSLRHTFQTIGDEARDAVATSFIMGHVDTSMADNYRESIGDERLAAVAAHVRKWLFAPKKKTAAKKSPAQRLTNSVQ
jgi:integrase